MFLIMAVIERINISSGAMDELINYIYESMIFTIELLSTYMRFHKLLRERQQTATYS